MHESTHLKKADHDHWPRRLARWCWSHRECRSWWWLWMTDQHNSLLSHFWFLFVCSPTQFLFQTGDGALFLFFGGTGKNLRIWFWHQVVVRKHDSQQETFFGDERGFIFERPDGTFRPSTELFPGLGSALIGKVSKKFFFWTGWVGGVPEPNLKN